MASRQAFRKAWWQVHKWGGLLLMALLIPLGLSGVVLAWDDAIDHALNPQRYAVSGTPALAPAAYAQAALKAIHPDERVQTLRYPDGEGPMLVTAIRGPTGQGAGQGKPGGDAQAAGAKKHGGKHDGRNAGPGGKPARISLWLDPATGRVLDIDRDNSGLVRFAHNFHGNLFITMPAIGRALIGVLGIVMFLMAVGGIWLWWPPVGKWVKGLRWQRGDRKLDTNLHHRIGFWMALPLALQAFTGVWIAWPQMLVAVGLAPAKPGQGMDRSRMIPAADTHLTADQALGAAIASRPGSHPLTIAWPTGDKAQWRVAVTTPTGPAEMMVDDGDASVTPAKAREGGLAATMRHIHDGTLIGSGWRMLLVLLGLTPMLLGVTGLLMWLRGRRWRAAATRRQRGSREPVAAA